ncbi:MAG: FecR domain-containing protein, partial [Phycisphaerae bacterium]|nr:FecR domain-containing protein [Phycisphaerae bacterium]MDW8263591.1 FecR domain-containing protein [Phycisphaerales bacterium]
MRKFTLLSVLTCSTVLGQTQPVDRPEFSEGPIAAEVTGVEGNVAIKRAGTDTLVKAEVGMRIEEGDEIQTGLRSAVRFVIPPDQTITIDRFSRVQLIRANFQNGRFNTELGMKYGRTRYDIEAAGRAHDAKVRSPSSVLAIRGTKVMLTDQPPFAPEAQSLTGRAFFRDLRKQVAVGTRGGGKTRVTAERDSPAQTALADATLDTRGKNASAETDLTLQFSPAVFAKLQEQGGVFEILGQANNQSIIDSLSFIGVVTGPQPSFELSFSGTDGSNVNLEVLTPLGDTVTILNQTQRSPSGGLYALESGPISREASFGADIVVFDDPFQPAPAGV